MRKMALKLVAPGPEAAPALEAAAKAAPVPSVTSEASQPAGSDVHITRTRTRDERDVESRRNTIDVEAIDDAPVAAVVAAEEVVQEEPEAPVGSDMDMDEAEDSGGDDDKCAVCGGAEPLPGNEIMLCDGDGCDRA